MKQLTFWRNSILTMAFLAILALSFLNSQDYLIDRSYGIDGTCPILSDLDLHQVTREMTIDSAGNIYVGFQYNLSGSLDHVITKIDSFGRVDNSFGTLGIVTDDIHFHKEGYLFSAVVIIDEATIINIFDQDLNRIARYITPGVITSQKEIRFDSSGYFIGSTEDAILFKYLASGSLDQSFGTGGLQDFKDIFPNEEVLECYYEYTKKNGSHICSVKTNFHHYVVELGTDGSMLKTTVVSAYLNSIGSSYVQKEIIHVTPMPHDRLLVYGKGKMVENIFFDYFMFVLDADLKLETEFGDNGIFQFPFEFQSRIPIGGLTNGNILCKDPTYADSQEDISFCKISLVNRSGVFREDLNTYNQIAIRDAYTDNNSAIHVDKNDFYVLSFESHQPGAYITKFTLDNVTTKIKESSETPQYLSLFPNPTSAQSNLLYTGATLLDARLIIYDANGRVVKQKSIDILEDNHILRINTLELAAGHYEVQIIHDKIPVSGKTLIIAR